MPQVRPRSPPPTQRQGKGEYEGEAWGAEGPGLRWTRAEREETVSQERVGVSRILGLERGCRLTCGGVTGADPWDLHGEVGGRESTSCEDFNVVSEAQKSLKGFKKGKEAKGGVYLDQRQKS